MFTWRKKRPTDTALPTVSFATTCWERDWRTILLDDRYLSELQIKNHCFPFSEKILIINNVKDEEEVCSHAERRKREGVLTNYYVARSLSKEVLDSFFLRREDFTVGTEVDNAMGATNDWVYFNAIGVLTAIYVCPTEYLLYLTGDVRLTSPIEWIPAAIDKMRKEKKYKVANLTWNEQWEEAARESYKEDGDFFVSKRGFSDQCFLVRSEDFKRPIYREIRKDARHFPRGDVFEKRVFSYMVNHGWLRITYKKGSYLHENL